MRQISAAPHHWRTRRHVLALLLVCVISAKGIMAHAQTSGSVTGAIVYADTGKPAGGINLWFTTDPPPSRPKPDPATGEYTLHDSDVGEKRWPAKVNGDGRFTVDLPPGSYLVHTFSPPYLSPDDTVYPTSNDLHVATGPHVVASAMRVRVVAGQQQHTSIRLQRGGSIEGIVKLGDGSPAVSDKRPPFGIAINAERKLGANSYARTGGAAHIASKGHYRLEGLAPGDYILFASTPGAMVQTASGMMGSSGLPVYAPGVAKPSAATVIHISGAETQQVNLTLPTAAALHSVQGSVLVNGEDALRHVMVRLYPRGEGGLTAAVPLQSNAEFLFDGVPDGEYTVSVEFPPRQEIVSADPAAGEIRMRTLPSLYGEATQDVRVSGQNVAGILLQPKPNQHSR